MDEEPRGHPQVRASDRPGARTRQASWPRRGACRFVLGLGLLIGLIANAQLAALTCLAKVIADLLDKFWLWQLLKEGPMLRQ